jgi:hypothetical protein
VENARITEIKNIGFVFTRIAGTYGVSLEIGKWAEVLEGAILLLCESEKEAEVHNNRYPQMLVYVIRTWCI